MGREALREASSDGETEVWRGRDHLKGQATAVSLKCLGFPLPLLRVLEETYACIIYIHVDMAI